jgi:hypothetical protein
MAAVDCPFFNFADGEVVTGRRQDQAKAFAAEAREDLTLSSILPKKQRNRHKSAY